MARPMTQAEANAIPGPAYSAMALPFPRYSMDGKPVVRVVWRTNDGHAIRTGAEFHLDTWKAVPEEKRVSWMAALQHNGGTVRPAPATFDDYYLATTTQEG